MRRNIVGQNLIARLTALALIGLCFMSVPVRAQEMPGYLVIFPSVGLVPGEKLRLTLFNRDGATVRAEAQVYHSGGINVGLGDGSVRFVQAGISQSFDVKHSDILMPGEEGTGRLQLRATLRITLAEPGTIKGLAVSMETVSILDGTSNTFLVGESIPSLPGSGGGRDLLVGGADRDVLMGIGEGQSLRATLFNSPFSGSEAQHRSVTGHVKIFDGGGLPIGESEEMVIPPGEFRSFDINRFALPPGEPGTNRIQVRMRPFFEFRSKRLTPVLASFEIIDNSTGRTVVMSGHQCLVFFLGGMEGGAR